MEFVSENQGLLGFLAVTVLVLAGAGWYFYRQRQATRHERHVENVIKSLGVATLRNVVLPDGVDGLSFIDYLLLTPKGIVVLTIKHREGLLFGGTAVDQWTQVINRKTAKFDNPLYAQPHHRQAVEWNSKDIATHGWVVFSNAGQFQKGMPDGCCMIDDLSARVAPLLVSGNEIPPTLRDAWAQLQDLSATHRAQLGRQHH